MKIFTLDDLLIKNRSSLIFECISGSRAYGTHHENSDEDIRGVYILPGSSYLNLADVPAQVADKTNDTVYYTLRRFVELASTANPNIIEMLYIPEDCFKYKSKEMDVLIKNRDMFISKQCYGSHIGYAQAQIKRAKGRNKWINNSQPEDKPVKEDFCWIIQKEEHSMPFRPIALKESGIELWKNLPATYFS